MALIVEDGTGIAGADSYSSVADCLTLLNNLGDTTWSALTTAQQEASLRNATIYLDYHYNWNGLKEDNANSLEFPRTYLYYEDGEQVVGLPAQLIQACQRLALRASTSDLESDLNADSYIKREKIDVLETEYQDRQSAIKVKYTEIDNLLKQFIGSSNGFTVGRA